MPIYVSCKCLIYIGRTGLGRTALPVCGQRATGAIVSGSVAMSEPLSFRQRCRAKGWCRGAHGHGRMLPCAVEQEKADNLEASCAGLD